MDQPAPAGGIPPVIHMLWLQGLDAAPEVVRVNVRRWATLNPEYRLNLLDAAGAEALLAGTGIAVAALTPQALSDVVRARLLLAHGGVWVDASVYPARRLATWLEGVTRETGFFAFARPAPDRPIASWFLAATPGHAMIAALWDRIAAYWSRPRAAVAGIPDDPVHAVEQCPDGFPYFWFHYLFESLLHRDPGFAAIWARCAQISADGPHALQFRLVAEPDLPADAIHMLLAGAPVHKLNWRNPYPLALLETLPALG